MFRNAWYRPGDGLMIFIIIVGGVGFVAAFFGFVFPLLFENKQPPQTNILPPQTTGSEFAAAILGGIITVSPFAYREFVQIPRLEIVWNPKSDAGLIPINTVVLSSNSTVLRKFLRVIVTNHGYKVAKACSATLKIDKDGRIDKCSAFSTESKALLWTSATRSLQTTVDIPPYDA